MKNKIFLFILYSIFSLTCITDLWAQASVNVSPDNPVYRDIDKLVAHGLVSKIIVGQKPFSRKEIARITAEALSHYPNLENKLQEVSDESRKQSIQEKLDYLAPILAKLKKEYQEELVQIGAISGEKKNVSLHAVEQAELGFLGTNSLPTTISLDNGLGAVNAEVNPLVQYDQGRHYVPGANFYLETKHWLRATPYFAAYIQPRFQATASIENFPNDNNVYLLNLYGKLNFKNVEIQVGRDNLQWGQGLQSGLMFSSNPRGLDMAKISNDSPFILPWVFKYLGAHKLSFFYTDLGPEQYYPHSYMTAWKWSWLPLSFMELGFVLSVESGGEGAPDESFWGRVYSSTLGFAPEDNGQDTTNKIGGMDVRFRIPPLRGTELYAEVAFEDRHNGTFSSAQWVDDAAYVGGIYFPRLNNTGSADLRFEYHQTGPRFYRHGDFRSGWTLNQFFIGDNLGPDAKGLYLFSNVDLTSRDVLKMGAAFEVRGNSIWAVDDPHEFNFIKIASNPSEYRYRTTLELQHQFQSIPLTLKPKVGYEHVVNYNFIQANSRDNYLLHLVLQFDFDRWTTFLK